MENNIVLELIKKDIDELKILVENLEKNQNQLLIDIATSKASTLLKEFELLNTSEASIQDKSTHQPEVIETPTAVEQIKSETKFSSENVPQPQETERELTSPIVDTQTLVTEEIETVDDQFESQYKEKEPEPSKPTIKETEIIVEETIEPVVTIEPETIVKPEEAIVPEPVVIAEDLIDDSSNQEIEAEIEKEETVPEEPIKTIPKVEEIPNETEGIVSETEQTLKKEQQVQEPITKQTETVSQTEELENSSEPELIEQTEINTETPKVLGEQFTKEPSLNERLATGKAQSKIKGKPVTCIKTAIGLNDRFLYTRELFGNVTVKFNEAVDALDNCNNLIEAVEYLEQNYKWPKNDTSLKFMDLVKRRFHN